MNRIFETIKRAITIENKVALINHSCHPIAEYGSYERVALEFGTSIENVKYFIKSGDVFRSGYTLIKQKDLFKRRQAWLRQREKRIARYQRKLDFEHGEDAVTIKLKMNQFLLNLR